MLGVETKATRVETARTSSAMACKRFSDDAVLMEWCALSDLYRRFAVPIYILRGLVHVRDFFLAFGIHQNGTTRKLDHFLPVFSSIDKAQTKGLVNLPDFLPNFCLMIKPKFDQTTPVSHTHPPPTCHFRQKTRRDNFCTEETHFSSRRTRTPQTIHGIHKTPV